MTPRKAIEYPDIAFGADIAVADGPHEEADPDREYHFAGTKRARADMVFATAPQSEPGDPAAVSMP